MRIQQSRTTKLLFAGGLFVISLGVAAGELKLDSGAQQTELVELFTSEGCSSCPPADRWLNRFLESSALWNSVIPLAFHVDYWDYIGWQDRFAKKEFSERQRKYAREFDETTVYTPGVRRAGFEWQSWRRDPTLKSFSGEERKLVGPLSAVVSSSGEVVANYSSPYQNDDRHHRLNIAILGMGLQSEVKRGENRGKTLQHNFVVLSLVQFAGKQESAEFNWQAQLQAPEIKASSYAVALWVSRDDSLRPVQAVGQAIPIDHPLHAVINKSLRN